MAVPDYLISTPENVDLHLEFAGLGNRILACLVDTALTYLFIGLTIGGFAFLIFLGDYFGLTPEPVKSALIMALVVVSSIVGFVVIFGYFIFFEGFWHGQTPGKRLVGIRVIQANGQPVSTSSVWLRNLIRSFDEAFFLIGLLSMLIDGHERRLGDLAANTIVIRERLSPASATSLKLTAKLSSEDSIDVGLLSPQEYELLTSFLSRRESMSPIYRPQVARKLAAHLSTKLRQHLIDADTANPENFLEKILLAYRARAEE